MRLFFRGGIFSAVFIFSLAGCLSTSNAPVIYEESGAFTVRDQDVDSVKSWISALADDFFEGRATGSPGYDLSADWCAQKLNALQIAPVAYSYYQQFKISRPIVQSRLPHSDFPEFDSLSTANVVGILKGSDPILRNEYVVLTAHLDHLGRKGDSVYHGANDNASGVATILGVVSFLKKNRISLKRSLVLIFFSGEEVGLYGSSYFVQHPLIPLDKIKLLINLDLVGSGRDGLMIQGYDRYPREFERIKSINERDFQYELSTRPNSPNSDQYHFNESGVPAFFIYSYNGTMPYHRPGDTADKIDTVVLDRVLKFVCGIVLDFTGK